MSELELILKEISDKWTRENFSRLLRYIDSQVILDGNWKVFELRFDSSVSNFKHKHRLDFVPQDIIVLQVIGNRNVEFNHDLFDKDDINITVSGPVYVKFLAGRYRDEVLSPDKRKGLTNVSIGGGGSGVSGEVTRTMNCAASLAVNDWVHQDPTTNNLAVKTADYTQVEPTIGLVKSKPSPTTAEVLLLGLYSGLTLPAGRGRLFLSSTGTAVFSFPSSGTGRFVRQLGIAFGDGTLYVNPNVLAMELDDG